MASLDILCFNSFNFMKIEHKKIFHGPSKILKNISWPINICLKYFMTPTKARLPPPTYFISFPTCYFISFFFCQKINFFSKNVQYAYNFYGTDLNVNMSRGAFRTQSNVYGRASLQKLQKSFIVDCRRDSKYASGIEFTVEKV